LRYLLSCLLLVFAPCAVAVEVAGVEVHDRVTARDGTELALHGAGLREKFFFDIYVGALYLPRTGQDLAAVRTHEGPARLDMHFTYDRVSQDKLAEVWNDGFRANNDQEVLDTIEPRLNRFIELLPAAEAGDTFTLEYLPGEGTEVRINGGAAGTIAGGVFLRALLAVWLGPQPADAGLKKALLGQS
jgi:hypothetical protein